MRVLDLIRFAIGALVGHRLRTVLSVAGVSVGIAAVVSLTALGEGARRYVTGEFEALGANVLIVLPGRVETTGAMPFGGVTHDLTLDDVRAMRGRLRNVLRVAPLAMGTETVRFGGLSRSLPVVGTTSDFREVRRVVVGAGRFLPKGDMDQGGNQVVLGTKAAEELFGSGNPLGQAVRIGEWRFRVIGVMAPRGRGLGFDFDDLVIIPVKTNLAMFNKTTLFRVFVEVDGADAMRATEHELEDLMEERHRVKDVTVIAQDSVVESFSSILGAMTLALAGIASVSLAVAGIGIMNVMLVSVSERRTEIGLLRALGAGKRQILIVFLVEAVMLSGIGGLLGLGIGLAAVAVFVEIYPAFPAVPPPWAIVTAIMMSLGVGVVFGVLPARDAVRLDPVQALARR
ncbi:MAG: ABC transporter permease [Acidobacteria bacterium]|nr:MAG: ABC transporter permease [Acidobacteriota bacterium]